MDADCGNAGNPWVDTVLTSLVVLEDGVKVDLFQSAVHHLVNVTKRKGCCSPAAIPVFALDHHFEPWFFLVAGYAVDVAGRIT